MSPNGNRSKRTNRSLLDRIFGFFREGSAILANGRPSLSIGSLVTIGLAVELRYVPFRKAAHLRNQHERPINRSSTAADFLEEWKAKREKMRAKMLGDIAASAAACGAALGSPNKSEARNAAAGAESNCPERERVSYAPTQHAPPPPHSILRSSALRKPEDEAQHSADPQGSPSKKTASGEKVSGPHDCLESDKDSRSPGSGSGPSGRKGRGQIERRKLREKRRSTGVLSIPSSESLDELDDDNADEGQNERKREKALTQRNTTHNEMMTSDFGLAHSLQETPKAVAGRYKSAGCAGHDEDAAGNAWHWQSRAGMAALERKVEELEKEVALERLENARLLKGLQDKDELIAKLKEEIKLLYRDLDDVEDENEQLKQENKTLLKVVGQLTR